MGAISRRDNFTNFSPGRYLPDHVISPFQQDGSAIPLAERESVAGLRDGCARPSANLEAEPRVERRSGGGGRGKRRAPSKYLVKRLKTCLGRVRGSRLERRGSEEAVMMFGMTLSIVHMLIPRNHGLLTSEAKLLTPQGRNTRPYSTAAPRRCTLTRTHLSVALVDAAHAYVIARDMSISCLADVPKGPGGSPQSPGSLWIRRRRPYPRRTRDGRRRPL